MCQHGVWIEAVKTVMGSFQLGIVGQGQYKATDIQYELASLSKTLRNHSYIIACKTEEYWRLHPVN